jgi:hypothetical protein
MTRLDPSVDAGSDRGSRIVVRLCDENAVVLAAVQDAARRLGDALRASWTAAARDSVGARRSGRQDGRLDRTTGWSLRSVFQVVDDQAVRSR